MAGHLLELVPARPWSTLCGQHAPTAQGMAPRAQSYEHAAVLVMMHACYGKYACCSLPGQDDESGKIRLAVLYALLQDLQPILLRC